MPDRQTRNHSARCRRSTSPTRHHVEPLESWKSCLELSKWSPVAGAKASMLPNPLTSTPRTEPQTRRAQPPNDPGSPSLVYPKHRPDLPGSTSEPAPPGGSHGLPAPREPPHNLPARHHRSAVRLSRADASSLNVLGARSLRSGVRDRQSAGMRDVRQAGLPFTHQALFGTPSHGLGIDFRVVGSGFMTTPVAVG
jgi:hypothetical protein